LLPALAVAAAVEARDTFALPLQASGCHCCLQDYPGYGATLDPAGYLEALLTFLFTQQQKDYEQLHGSRGMPK
jgi:hypothetical protein